PSAGSRELQGALCQSILRATIRACPHCGNDDEFYVVQRYSGQGVYRRCFDGSSTDNTEMYNCLAAKVSKRAFCGSCDKPVASWDEDADGPHYTNNKDQ
ncbi:hypothetical protein K5D43_26825, partial [Pseudomonas cichorii]